MGVQLKNRSGSGGRLRASVACDTGAGVVVRAFSRQAGPGQTAAVKTFDTAGCQSVVAVITNVARTGANPPSSDARPYRLTVGPPLEGTKTTLQVKVNPGSIIAKGKLKPKHPGERMRVTLFERDGRRWDRVARKGARLKGGKRYRVSFPHPNADRCRVESEFPGDANHLPSRRAKTVAC